MLVNLMALHKCKRSPVMHLVFEKEILITRIGVGGLRHIRGSSAEAEEGDVARRPLRLSVRGVYSGISLSLVCKNILLASSALTSIRRK